MKRRLIAAGIGMLLVTACANDDDTRIDQTIATLEESMIENDPEDFSDDGETVEYLLVESPDY